MPYLWRSGNERNVDKYHQDVDMNGDLQLSVPSCMNKSRLAVEGGENSSLTLVRLGKLQLV